MNRLLTLLALPALLFASCAKKTETTKSAPAPVRPRNTGASIPAGSLPPGTKVSYSSAKVTGRFIALTFDDGPHASNTPRLLDMLRQRNLKATFYTVGTNVARYPNIMRRIVAEGHEVANHTWTHPSLSKLSDGAVRSELQRSHDALVKIIGTAPRTYRPPYGAITARQMQWIFDEFGYPTIKWSVDPRDWQVKNASIVTQNILRDTQPGGIVLVHDIHASSIDAMPATLDGLLSRGFQFLTVSQLIGLSQRAPVTPGSLAVTDHSPGSF